MKKLLLGLMLILLVSNVMALDSLGVFRQGDVVRITQVCSDATYINISSISAPNSSALYSNVNMTFVANGEYYFDLNRTNDLGRYDVRGVSDGCEEEFAIYFDITPTGDEPSTAQGIIYVAVLAMGIFLFILITYGAVKIPFHNKRSDEGYILGINDLKYVKIFLIAMSYMALMWVFYMAHGVANNLLFLNVAGKLFYGVFRFLLGFLFPIIVVTLIIGIVAFVGDKKLVKRLGKGLRIK